MKKLASSFFALMGLVIFTSFSNSCVNVLSQSSQMREIPNTSQAIKQAPAECLATFREFFKYVQKSNPNIVTDEKAQDRWLTKSMKRDFTEHIKRSGEENPGYPSNQDFVLVWNNPTTYSIVGSRHYDFRNNDNPNDNRVIIDVLYEWDEKTDGLNNQYPGEKGLHSFIFVYEDGVWKLDDIYTFDDEYASPQSLRNYFRQ